jgi:DNA-binding NarL/FixJ family response regulator
MSVRVAIVDDHPIVRSGLRAMLEDEPDIEVVGDAAGGSQAVELTARTKPDVLLMDLRMPDVDGVAATRQIRDKFSNVQVLILTTYDTDADIERAIQAGALGYLLKDATRDELVRAIRAAASGSSVLAPSVASRLMERMRTPRHENLSARELEILLHVARGKTNKDIGAALHISEATIKTHLLHIFGKLGVQDRTQAVTVAVNRGLLRLD